MKRGRYTDSNYCKIATPLGRTAVSLRLPSIGLPPVAESRRIKALSEHRPVA